MNCLAVACQYRLWQPARTPVPRRQRRLRFRRRSNQTSKFCLPHSNARTPSRLPTYPGNSSVAVAVGANLRRPCRYVMIPVANQPQVSPARSPQRACLTCRRGVRRQGPVTARSSWLSPDLPRYLPTQLGRNLHTYLTQKATRIYPPGG